MESGEQMFPWAGDKYLVDDEFTYVVDLDDIAPFCEFPGTKAGDLAAAKAAGPGWARNVVHGFTSADGWKLIHYMDTKSPTVTMKLPREETVDGLSIVLNVHYAVATKIHVLFDDDPDPVVLATKPNAERQDFSIGPRKCRRLTVRLAEFNKVGTTTGIDNLWVHVQRPADWPQRVRPLLNIGGLVKYPMGAGGVILNQLRAKPSEAVPVNAQKKQVIVATLLRNLHATFAGGRILTAANLKFHPLPLEEQCNQYLTKDRGWFDGGRDLAHLPIGKQDFCGVSYLIRDFRTSPAAVLRDVGRAGGPRPASAGRQGAQGRLQGRRAVLPARLQPHRRVAPPAAGAAGAGTLQVRGTLRRRADGRRAGALRRRGRSLDQQGAGRPERRGAGLGGAFPRRQVGRAGRALPVLPGPTRGPG